ncbi:MAG: flagellar basal body P-ring protein FlgI [Tepidisphaeraceae bacterium]
MSCRWSALALLVVSGMLLAFVPACRREKPPEKRVERYADLGPKQVPSYLNDTIYQRTDLQNTEGYLVTGYGLVVRLLGTGDSTAPLLVKDYIIKEMVKHGFGSKLMPGMENFTPEDVLRSGTSAIVQVTGYLPPGARAGQNFDVVAMALPQSNTSSLAHGTLYQTDLQMPGANPGVNVLARSQGPLFVNPALAVGATSTSSSAVLGNTSKASLRTGVVMDGGVITNDRPLVLRLRTPQRSMARAIEMRIDQHFQDGTVAAAQDEGQVFLYVPERFRGDWEHFTGIVTHLYMNASTEFAVRKATELAAAAPQPGAPLMDISYAWEGLGFHALPTIRPLMTHATPEVAFAAARAAAFLGDGSAQEALLRMAATQDHPFQVTAVQTLGALPNSPIINGMLRKLLDSEQTVVRVEAYKVLARHRSPAVFSRVIGPGNGDERFVLDIVSSQGSPVVYASRMGIPRIAIIGERAAVTLPITWTAMDGGLMLASEDTGRFVTLFYRGAGVAKPIKLLSRPDLPEIIARLGGVGPKEDPKFDFTYGDVVGIVQALADGKKVASLDQRGSSQLASFVLQEPASPEQDIFNPPAPIQGRPQTDQQATSDELMPNLTKPATAPADGSRMNGAAARN